VDKSEVFESSNYHAACLSPRGLRLTIEGRLILKLWLENKSRGWVHLGSEREELKMYRSRKSKV